MLLNLILFARCLEAVTQMCSINKKTPVLMSLFNKVTGFQVDFFDIFMIFLKIVIIAFEDNCFWILYLQLSTHLTQIRYHDDFSTSDNRLYPYFQFVGKESFVEIS